MRLTSLKASDTISANNRWRMKMEIKLPPEREDANLAKITAVVADTKSIPRDGNNKFAGYKYATVDQVFESVRGSMSKHGLALDYQLMGLEEITHRNVGFLVLNVGVKFRGDDEYVTHPVPLNTAAKGGVRLDAQGIQAAISYALKYFLRSTLMLNTGDADLDAEAGQVVDPKDAPPPPKQQQSPPKTDNKKSGGDALRMVNGQIFYGSLPLHECQQTRNLSVGLWKTLNGLIVDKDATDAQVVEIIEKHETDIFRLVPARGLKSLAVEMKKRTLPSALIDRFEFAVGMQEDS